MTMGSRNDVLAARDAALACLDSLLHAGVELEKCWPMRQDTVGESCTDEFRTSGCCAARKPTALEAFMDDAMSYVEDMRRCAALAMDEALTNEVCTALELARTRDGLGQVTLAGRSYSNCHLAAVDHVARLALCWPGCFPLDEAMQKLREATSEIADELREIAMGIRAEAAAALGPDCS